jgi:hypothetical protein
MWKPLATVLAGLAVAALPVAAQVQVTTLAKGDTPLRSTAEIRVSRFADFTETDSLAVGAELSEGDLLTALSPDLLLELTCPRGTQLHFSGGFRVLIGAAGEDDCALSFLSGDLDVLTDEPTSVDAGGQVLGTHGTRYAVQLARSGGQAQQWVWVFEGKLDVAGGRDRRTLASGRTLELSGELPPAETAIPSEAIRHWAAAYARTDLVKARAAGVDFATPQGAGTEAKLVSLYTKVLAAPDDSAARLDLAKVQVENRLGAAAAHNLKRIDPKSQRDLERLRLDPGKIKSGDPAQLEQLQKLILRTQPGAGVVGSTETPSASAGHAEPGAVLSADELTRWLLEGRLADVAGTLETLRKRTGDLDARRTCLLARAYAGLGSVDTAANFARRALAKDEQGDKLNASEMATCRKLSYGASP